MTLDRDGDIRANQQPMQQDAPQTLPGEAAVSLPADPTSALRPR